MFTEYTQYDGLGLAELVRQKKVKPSELLAAAIGRCEAVNPRLNAVVMRHDDIAKARAAELDSALPDAPFAGVPFLLKDLYLQLTGTSTTQGSRVFANVPAAEEDSYLTAAYKDAGFMIFGKTNSPEMGLTGTTEPQLYGATRNPWDLERSPGGSSGGSGAAVAAGIVPLAHASDGGGSIRIPASACGLVGLKPSRGRVSSGPLRGEGWAGMSINHVVSRSVRDSAAALDISLRTANGEPYAAPSPQRPYLEEAARPCETLKIAFSAERPDGAPLHEDCAAALAHACELLRSLKHELREQTFKFNYDEMLLQQSNVISANMAAMRQLLEQAATNMPLDQFETATARSMERGKDIIATDYITGVNYIHNLGRAMGTFLDDAHLYLTPTLGTPPVKLGHLDMMDENMSQQMARWREYCPFTGLANMTGQPSISLPLYRNKQGLPIGLMFTARYGEEDRLIRLAAALEKAEPWPTAAAEVA